MSIERESGLLGYERVYLPLYKVAYTPFLIQGDDVVIHYNKVALSFHMICCTWVVLYLKIVLPIHTNVLALNVLQSAHGRFI